MSWLIYIVLLLLHFLLISNFGWGIINHKKGTGSIQPPGWGLGRTRNACPPTPAGSHRTPALQAKVCIRGQRGRLPSFPGNSGSRELGAEGSLGSSPPGLPAHSPGFQADIARESGAGGPEGPCGWASLGKGQWLFFLHRN